MESFFTGKIDEFQAVVKVALSKISGSWAFVIDSLEENDSILQLSGQIVSTQKQESSHIKWHDRRKNIILIVTKLILKTFKAKSAKLRSINNVDIVSISEFEIENGIMSELSLIEIDNKVDIKFVIRK